MGKKRRNYDDDFRASAVLMLQAQGWPDKKGALTSVANHLKIHSTTLRRWASGESNPPPDNIVGEKKEELIDMLNNEIDAIFVEMKVAREDASYRDLGVVFGILLEKRQLITGEPTAINEQRTDTRERLRAKLDSLATRNGAGNVLELTRSG